MPATCCRAPGQRLGRIKLFLSNFSQPTSPRTPPPPPPSATTATGGREKCVNTIRAVSTTCRRRATSDTFAQGRRPIGGAEQQVAEEGPRRS